MTFKTLILSVVAVVLSAGLAMADSLAERLEKGIYTEETVGDLDAAKDIYEQIVADAKTDRIVAAQAQFRLAQCLLKQEKKDAAVEAFKKLIEEFADQKELVAKAKKHAPVRPDFELLPEPWVDGESLQFQVELAGGLDIGTFVFSVRSSREDDKDIWLTNVGRYIHINAPNQGIGRVKVDRTTFRPISSLFHHSILGQFDATYAGDEVTIKTVSRDGGKQNTRKIELDGTYYDNEQGMMLFRRLPLAKGFEATIPILATMSDGALEIDVEVSAQETIDVPPENLSVTGWYCQSSTRQFGFRPTNTAIRSNLTGTVRSAPWKRSVSSSPAKWLSIVTTNEDSRWPRRPNGTL